MTGTKNSREHNVVNSLYLEPDELEKMNFERYKKYEEIQKNEVMYEEFMMDDAEICLVAFGVSSRVSKNAIIKARENGVKVGLFRPISLWPFPSTQIKKYVDQCKAFVSVEMSMGQMIDDVKLAIDCKKPVYLCNRAGGMIPTPEDVLSAINNVCGGDK